MDYKLFPETETKSLPQKDCLYIIDRYIDAFSPEIHISADYEFTLICNCKGVKRMSGHDAEALSDIDLTLAGPGAGVVYIREGEPASTLRIVTVVFSRDLFSSALLNKTLFSSIGELLDAAAGGVVFTRQCAMSVFGRLEALSDIKSDFARLLEFLSILYSVSAPGCYRARQDMPADEAPDSRDPRVALIQKYILANFRSDIKLADLAALAGLTPTAFSRFYKMKTGCSVSDFIIDIRLNYAASMLTETDKAVSEICTECGFKNVSNFNRIFRKKRSCTPRQYRESYRAASLIC